MATPDIVARPRKNKQRRHLAILFADLTGSTRLAASMEAEDYADLLEELHAIYYRVIARHGGTIFRIVGDGVFASFGYPELQENEGRRATEAALELHSRVRTHWKTTTISLNEPLALHSGIHAGLSLVGDGDDVTGRSQLFGPAVNIAARLSDEASADEILVSMDTLGAERHFFETARERSITLNDVDEPVNVFSIEGRSTDINTRFEALRERGLTPFLGRGSELKYLSDTFASTLENGLHCVALQGPAGLGKTRLAECFLDAIDENVRIFRSYCESYLIAEPAQPILQILRQIFDLQTGQKRETAVQLVRQALLDIDPVLMQHELLFLRMLSLEARNDGEPLPNQPLADDSVSAVRDLFAAITIIQPVVLFVDDWQWADDLTRHVISGVRELRDSALFVLFATRDPLKGEIGIRKAETLSLLPLDEAETQAAIAELSPNADVFLVEEILKAAGGNPLFIEELCHSSSYERPERNSQAFSGSAWLDILIEARVERLPLDQRDLVQTAAVIGNVISAEMLEVITGCAPDHPLIEALSEQDLIFPGVQEGTLRFKHGIARDVIYNSIGLRRKRTMHLEIATRLKKSVAGQDANDVIEALAYHFSAGGRPEEAAQYAEKAGDKAMAASALDRAQAQYMAALKNLDQLENTDERYKLWLSIAQRLGQICVFDPARTQLAFLLRAIDVTIERQDDHSRAYAEFWAGYVYYALGDTSLAEKYLIDALGRARQLENVGLVAWCNATLGQSCAASGSYDASIRHFQQAFDGRPSSQKGKLSPGYAYSLACKASVLGDRGQFDDAYACFDEALAVIDGAGHEVEGSVRCWRSCVLIWQGRWHEANICAEEALQVSERVKSLYLYSMSLSLSTYAKSKLHGPTTSLQPILDATTWLESYGKRLFLSLNYGWMANELALRQQWHDLRYHVAGALRNARRRDRLGEAMACRSMARAAAVGQTRKPVTYYLGLAMECAEAKASPRELALNRYCDAETRIASGQTEGVLDLIGQAHDAFADMDMNYHRANISVLRAKFIQDLG